MTQAERSIKHRQFKSAWLNKQKDKPCIDCGIKYPCYVMDFDHIGTKTFNINNGKYAGIKRIKEELKHCEVVCSNCHRERTYKRILNATHPLH